jgi:hypothetical protein
VKVVRTIAALAVAFLATAGSASAEGLPSKVDVRGDRVSFFPYTNETLLAGEGNVVVRTGTRTITCDALRWDLQKNRLTATGHVHVSGGAAPFDGAAYVRDLKNGDGYLMSVDPVPATFALHNDDMATATEGPPPAKTFDAVDLDGQRPFMRSRHAIVTPGAAIRMSPAQFPTGAGPALTIPTYLYTLVQNQSIALSAAPSTSFDQPYSLFGSPNSLTAAHIRYDSYNGVTEAIDEHLVDGNRAYFVTSVLPFRDKQFDLLAYQVLVPGLQQTLTGSHTFGADPQNVLTYRLQESGKLLTQTLTYNQFDASNSAEFDLGTYEHDIKHIFGYQLKTSYGYDHNYAGFPYSNDFRLGADGIVIAPPFSLGGVAMTAKYEYGITGYDYPHELTTGTTTFTADRKVNPAVNLFAQVQIEQYDNRFRDLSVGRIALGLPTAGDPTLTPDGEPYLGYYAYAGLTTYRSYELQSTLNGRGDNRVQLTFYYTHDFPQYNGFGRPPYYATIDIVRRISPSLRIEIGRSYSFGWAGQYLSPQYTFGISP